MEIFLRRIVEMFANVIYLINLHATQRILDICVDVVLQSCELVVWRTATKLDLPDIEIRSINTLESMLFLCLDSVLEKSNRFGLVDFNRKEFPGSIAVNKAIKGDLGHWNLWKTCNMGK